MVLETLVIPTIEKYGRIAANEIVRGFEEARWIGDFAEQDFVKQVQWKDAAPERKFMYKTIFDGSKPFQTLLLKVL